MDVFTQLNYCYPGTPNATRLHVSQQLRGSSCHVSGLNVQPLQDRSPPGSGHAHSDPSGITHAHSSPDLTSDLDSHPQQKSTLVDLRGAADSDHKHPSKICYVDEFTSLSDQYIPSPNDKITCTNHRPLDEIFGNLTPSSGWPQTTSSSPDLSKNGRTDGQYRHTSVLVYALPTKPQLDGVIQIPLLAVDNQTRGTGLVVDFQCSDWGIGVQVEGIPMPDLLHGNVSGLESPYQRVLDGFGIINLRLNILWPHYPPFVKVISAFGTDGKSLTRAELGYEVSLAFAEFFYQITSRSTVPAQPGPYAISSSPLGSSYPGIRFEQLHLITVRNTSRGEWMAEIRAVSIP